MEGFFFPACGLTGMLVISGVEADDVGGVCGGMTEWGTEVSVLDMGSVRKSCFCAEMDGEGFVRRSLCDGRAE